MNKKMNLKISLKHERGYADKENPSVRYNIYTPDYGTKVDFISTTRQPEIKLKETDKCDEKVVLPFDDRRSNKENYFN